MNIITIIIQYASVGDYIFLIMIVVASIIQTISQNRKKKALLLQKQMEQSDRQSPEISEKRPEVMTGYDTPSENIFESIQKMLIPEFEEKQVAWGEDYPETVTERRPVVETKESSNNPEEELCRKIEKRHEELFIPKPVADIPAVRFKSGVREGFSLRKAVVYSEILNRKYT